jgi:hypothetical protein
MNKVSVDKLSTKKSLIDLQSHSDGDFGIDDFVLKKVLGDVILVEYIDIGEGSGGEAIERNGIYIPTNTLKQAWRKAEVVLVGPEVEQTEVGDYVLFPNDIGVTVANVDVDGRTLKKGIFLNEQRIFGILGKK